MGLAFDPKKRTKGWAPNPWAIQHLYKPIGQHSTTKKPLKTLHTHAINGANILK